MTNTANISNPDREPADDRFRAAVRRLQWHLFTRDVAPFRADLQRYCLHLTGNDDRADDLVQEALMRGFAVVSKLHDGLSNPRAFLFRAASNLWIDWVRKNRSRDTLEVPSESNADPALSSRYLDETLVLLTRRLPPTELRALVLRDLYGYTGAEAARLMGTTPAAVKMAVSRARRRLSNTAAPIIRPTVSSGSPPSTSQAL